MGTPPSYTNLRIFCCLCYVISLPKGHIFSSQASPCVFLGYYTIQKGYKVMNLHTEHLFVSRDVVFHEDHFPFADPSQPLPAPSHASVEDEAFDNSLISSSPPAVPIRKSTRPSVPPIWTKDYTCPTLSNISLDPISASLNYSVFSSSYQSFLASFSSVKEPHHYHEALTDSR